jgi:hypothetical protein
VSRVVVVVSLPENECGVKIDEGARRSAALTITNFRYAKKALWRMEAMAMVWEKKKPAPPIVWLL